MAPRPYAAVLFVLYQLSLLVGIALLPVAVLSRQVGLDLPAHRLVRRLGEAYQRTT